VIELLRGDFERSGYEIDDVRVEEGASPPRITVVADGDVPLDLDTVAELSRAASERLDALPELAQNAQPYVLEVSSPGVDRPLTAEKHYRRARGRKAELLLADGTAITGRIAGTAGGVLQLVTRPNPRAAWAVREIALADVTNAVVQVEFSPPSARELELVEQTEQPKPADAGDAGTEA
jgi:ribosome maturation factor RimP